VSLRRIVVRTYTGDIRPYLRLDSVPAGAPGSHPGGGWVEWARLPRTGRDVGGVRLVAMTVVGPRGVRTRFLGNVPAALKRLHRRMAGIILAAHRQAGAWWEK